MFGKRFTVFRLLGFEVKLDVSWLILAGLIVSTLATEFFPHYYSGLTSRAHWLMAIGGTLGLFFSIVFHELCHSLVARRFGLPMKGITLFIFGGVAEMTREPPSARAEFLMAVAGPFSSMVLASFLFLLSAGGRSAGWPVALLGVFSYLALLNLVLATFNLVPAFPLDGGRIMRSAIWAWKKDLLLATKIATASGLGFAYLLMAAGLFGIFTGKAVAGLWWLVLGIFLKSAAEHSYKQVVFQKLLEGQKISHFMKSQPVTVSADLALREFIEDYVYVFHYRFFPVVKNDSLLGCINVSKLKNLDKKEWDSYTVENFTEPCCASNTVGPDEPASQVLSRMQRTGNTKLLVVENGKLLGIVSLKDMLSFLSLRLELESTDRLKDI